jgi:hypothetical protein
MRHTVTGDLNSFYQGQDKIAIFIDDSGTEAKIRREEEVQN